MFAIIISPSDVRACSPSIAAGVPGTATTSGVGLVPTAGRWVAAAAGADVVAAATWVGAAAGADVEAAGGAVAGTLAGGAAPPQAASRGMLPSAAALPNSARRNCRRVGRVSCAIVTSFLPLASAPVGCDHRCLARRASGQPRLLGCRPVVARAVPRPQGGTTRDGQVPRRRTRNARPVAGFRTKSTLPVHVVNVGDPHSCDSLRRGGCFERPAGDV